MTVPSIVPPLASPAEQAARNLRASVARIGGRLARVAARTRLLLLGLFPSSLGRLMMANNAAGPGTEDAVMSRKVACDPADCRALQATGRVRRLKPAGSHEKSEGCWQ